MTNPGAQAMLELADYLDFLEQELIGSDADLKLPENLISPGIWADRIRASAVQGEPVAWVDAAALQAAHEIVALPENWTYTRKKAAIQVIVAREMTRALAHPAIGTPDCTCGGDFERVFRDACDEAGCDYDNEALLKAISDLKLAVHLAANTAWLKTLNDYHDHSTSPTIGTPDSAREELECLRSIAEADDREPREPDDADWRFRFLEAKRAAQCALAALPSEQDGAKTMREALISAKCTSPDGTYVQASMDEVLAAVVHSRPHQGGGK